MKKIPLVDLHKEYLFFKKDIDAAIRGCLRHQQWILGREVRKFEEKFASYIGVTEAIGVASGTDALLLSLRALCLSRKGKDHFGPKDEIITTPFSFAATAESILRSGATPVFVDIDPSTFTLDIAAVKKAITKNTLGIVPVHLYGLSPDMDELSGLARKRGLFIIEDVAQACGASFLERKAGSWGDCGAFSFFPTKILGGFGDGGLVSVGNKRLAGLLRALRDHGQTRPYYARYRGYNSRLDSLQAAILLAKLGRINTLLSLRRKAAQRYTSLLASSGFIVTPREPSGCVHAWNLYTIKVAARRNRLLGYLKKKNIAARVYYPIPLYNMKAFSPARCRGTFSGTKEASAKVLSLPFYPFLRPDQIRYVAKEVINFITGKT
jgi:dTDP-4-amino-4,6-dideoxygalactose transaminase